MSIPPWKRGSRMPTGSAIGPSMEPPDEPSGDEYEALRELEDVRDVCRPQVDRLKAAGYDGYAMILQAFVDALAKELNL